MLDRSFIGTREFEQVTALNLNIRNGSVTCEAADLPTGQVVVDWDYEGLGLTELSADDLELRLVKSRDRLSIEDWIDNKRTTFFGKLKVKLNLRVKHGPGVSVIDLNHGNGTYTYTGNAAGDLNLGNGTLNLSGEPAGKMLVNLGNGEICSDWLLCQGALDINLGNGSVDMKLRPGSGVSFDGSVGIGGIDAPPGVKVRRSHMLGAELSGSLGDGTVPVDISLGNGSIEISQ